MVDISTLRTGMTVKIVDAWEVDAMVSPDGEMDIYLGTVVTVHGVNGRYVTIEEDAGDGPRSQGGHWYWYADMLDYIVCSGDCEQEYEVSSDTDIHRFLLEVGLND